MIDDDPVLRRRIARRQAEHRKQLIAAISGITGVLVLVCGVVWALANKRQGGSLGGGATTLLSSITAPSASSEGNKWTHKELLDYLNSKGLKLRVTSAIGGFSGDTGPSAHWAPPNGDDEHNSVRVDLCATDKHARETAGVFGGEAFSWGRFCIRPIRDSEPECILAIKRALN